LIYYTTEWAAPIVVVVADVATTAVAVDELWRAR
jgi:hypothetical protein